MFTEISVGTSGSFSILSLLLYFFFKFQNCIWFCLFVTEFHNDSVCFFTQLRINHIPQYSCLFILYTQLCNLKIIRKKFQCHLHILTVVHMLICVNMMLSDRKCFQIICLFRKSDFSSLIWYIKWFLYSIQLNILWLRPGWSSCLCINKCPD